MEMTIEESLNNLKNLQEDYQQFHDDVWQDPESYGVIAESLRIVIDTMRKYQKIAELYDYWRSGKCEYTISCMENIGKILREVEDDRN